MEHTMNHGNMDVGHSGHGGHDHHAMMIADFRRRFWVVLVLTAPVMALSPMIQHWLGIHWTFTGSGSWATGYNAVAMPLAAGVLYHWGVLLSPAAGAVLMSASTLVVAVNASL